MLLIILQVCGDAQRETQIINAIFNGVQLVLLTWLTQRAAKRDWKENHRNGPHGPTVTR